jgi:hypothetical protein
MTSTLKKITTKAKQLYKTGKYAKWTDAIKEASKSLHKSASKTVKKHATKVKKYAVKKAKSGIKSLAKKVYESKHLSGVKTKKKATPKSLHKDTMSHNVKISVMSGTEKRSNVMVKMWQEIYGNLAQEYISTNNLKERKNIKKEMSKIKLIIDDIKKLNF